MGRYRAVYTYDGRGWVVQFGDPDISTFGRTLAAAKVHARSLLAVHLELDDLAGSDVEIEDEVRLPANVQADVERLGQRRLQADSLRSQVAEETRRTAAELRRVGLSTRDVGEILGISGARVAQIERERVPA